MTRFGWVVATSAAALAIGASSFAHPAPRLLWNATASTPVGFYAVQPVRALHVGDLVATWPPEALARFLAEGGYLPMGVPLLKQVAAVAGQSVCRTGRTVTIDGIAVAAARERDSRGRDLPVWSGCRILEDGEILLLNRHPDSLDGRYFGPLPVSSVIGRATPLWLPD
ncbi:MAG: conjugal transfer protein [Stygiobacter sp.]|nr:MAG: conjugal transfer protein [Stygiobacter sp.]